MSGGAPVAVFGGTFNPIHFGHLRSALELLELLGLEQLRFMPAQHPPHRPDPAVSAEDRASMIDLAIHGEARFVCDRRELQRSGPSYTYDSLCSLRKELGPERPLAMVLGCDAVATLDSWHRWDQLCELAHIVVLSRPGWSLAEAGRIADYLREAAGDPDVMRHGPAGRVVFQSLTPMDVSSTTVRGLLQSGRSPRYLLPDSVLDYIQSRSLYMTEQE
ncbi:MAG: nicotinate-nucleotide adenylyltransferase [Congregibacter sp.]